MSSLDWRFELKLIDQCPHLFEAYSHRWVKCYPDRSVTSFYFDTPDFHLLRVGMDGFDNRFICRYRVYDSVDPSTLGQLEIKYSTEAGDRKKVVETSFERAGALILDQVGLATSPKVCISYRRTYLLEENMDIRVTIDRDLRYSDLNNQMLSRSTAVPHTIFEIKGPAVLKPIGMSLCGFNSEVRYSKYAAAALALGLITE